MKKSIFISLACCSFFFLNAQSDTIPESLPELNQQRLEDLLQDADEDASFEFNTVFEHLNVFLKNPLDLNKAAEEDLLELGLLSDIQINNLLSYRQRLDGFLAIYELQTIPGFDLETIQQILPYVAVNKGVDDFQVPFKTMLTEGENTVFLRWKRVLEQQAGFLPVEGFPDSTRYLGDPNQVYFRYRHQYSNRFSFGFTAEKDRGEEFFKGSNKSGFDYYSAHIFLKDYNRTIKAVALGDYSANFGQGLVLFSGFGYGKSSLVTSVKRGGRALKQYTSVNEAIFLRGAATTLALHENVELTMLFSSRQRDGNLIEGVDTLGNDLTGEFSDISSLSTSGLHRTSAEIADKNAVRHTIVGASAKWKRPWGHIALNGLQHQLDKPLTLTPQPYNVYYFRGDQLLNTSIDYAWRRKNLSVFGETAMSDNGAIATINGLLLTLDQSIDLAMVYRNFPADYQALLADPFAETSGGRNEIGLYTGVEIRPAKNWKIAAYYDTWKHPWLRFTTDGPSGGVEYRFRVTYFQKRKMQAYVEVRDETKDVNARVLGENLDAVIPNRRFQTRLHFAYKINKALEWRSRLDLGFTDDNFNTRETGFAITQDLLYKPVAFPFIFSTRFALFDTDGYQVRFYHYENGLLNNFAIPAYYNQGSRFYFNIRYKGIRNMTIEARYARLYWADQDSVGSSLEATGKPTRTEVGAQIKYKF